MRDVCPCRGDNAHKLIAELISKKNARRNNNNSARGIVKQCAAMLDHDNSLATTSGDNDLTMISASHCSK